MKHLVLLSTLLLTGCGSLAPTPEERSQIVYEDVQRIFWHRLADFTIVVPSETAGALKFVRLNPILACGYEPDVLVYKTQKPEEPMRVVATQNRIGGSTCMEKVELYLHDVSEINTAGWSNGKFGSGSTQVIE